MAIEAQQDQQAVTAAHFDVFLSHNSKDKPVVERLAEKLQRAGIEPWLDKWCLTPGGRWQDELVEGLHACAACAIFVGPHGLGDWVREELGVALDRAAKNRAFRLFLVLLPGLPEPFDATTLPPFLSTRTWIDLRSGIENPRAFQSLISAIKGIPIGPSVAVDRSADICPYRGLQPFDEDHADYFYGRESEIQRLIEKLKATRFLTVIGPSGNGKSSLVRAGLLPALRRGGLPGSETWARAVFTPGAHPLTNLAAQLTRLYPQEGMHRTLDSLAADARTLHLATALAMADRPALEKVVWVIDQFEETFTLCHEEHERSQFIANLLYAAGIPEGRCLVILTLRADFYPKCAAYPELSSRVAAQQFLVSPMDLDGLRQAIEEPAYRVGLEFEEGLVATILEDVANQPGALPLLEHALLELWERRRGGMLTLEGYRESGGVQGAIAKRADAVYSAFNPEQQEITRRTMLRLTQPGEGTEDTRRRALMTELVTRPGANTTVERVVDTLVEARLLTTSGDDPAAGQWVDVAHEALIRGWPRLRHWIDEDRSGLRVHRRLTEAAQEWERSGRDESLLYRGARMASAIEWRQHNDAALNDLERAFLDASVALQVREHRAAQRRRLVAIGGLTTALVAISIFAVFAFIKQQQADADRKVAVAAQHQAQQNLTRAQRSERQARQSAAQARQAAIQATLAKNNAIKAQRVAEVARRTAEAAQRESASRQVAASAMAQLPIDPELSILLATQAVQIESTPQAEDALRQAIALSHVRVTLRGHTDAIYRAVFSPDGRYAATASRDGTARIWDARTGQLLHAVLHANTVNTVVFSPNDHGARIATASFDKTARVWDARTGRPLTPPLQHGNTVYDAEFSPDGRTVVTASADGTARVWDAWTGQPVTPPLVHQARVNSAAFSPDGRTVVTASVDGTARVWDARTGQPVTPPLSSKADVNSAAFSPDGRTVVTASGDSKHHDYTARIWDARTGRLLHVLSGHSGIVYSAAFSPDNRSIVTGSGDDTARLWDARTGRNLLTLSGHTNYVTAAAFSPDGTRIATAGGDGTARVWDVATGQNILTLSGHSGQTYTAVFSPNDDGRLLLTASADATARVWAVSVEDSILTLPIHHGWVNAAAFSPDGTRIVTANGDGKARVFDAASGHAVLPPLAGYKGSAYNAAYCAKDGSQLVVAGYGGAQIWNATTGTLIRTLAGPNGHKAFVNDAVFSPDCSYIATAGSDGTNSDGTSRNPTAKLWSAVTGQYIRTFSGHTDAVYTVAYSPDGQYLVTASRDGTARVWDVSTGKSFATLRAHSEYVDTVTSAAFGPDDNTVVTANYDDHTARVWEVDTEQSLLTLRGHNDAVLSAQFSPNGKLILTASNDRTERVWDAATGQSLITLRGHTDLLNDATFSADGKDIVSASSDGTARVYACDICGGSAGDLLALAAQRVTRRLTTRERALYLPQGQPVAHHNPDNGTTHNFLAVSCPSAIVCYAQGYHTFASTDGGQHWITQTGSPEYYLAAQDCPTTRTCYAAGEKGAIVATTDGGATWTPQRSGVSVYLHGMACPTVTICYAVGKSGTIIATSDGGRTWHGLANPDTGKTKHHYEAITCLDVRTCYATGYSTVATTDGGRTWRLQTGSPTYYLYGIACPNARTCYAVGDNGTIVATTDGGTTWSSQTSGTTRTLYSVACLNMSTCYAVGDYGTVITTADGGTTWSRLSSGTLAELKGITCPSGSLCYIVGYAGTIITRSLTDTMPLNTGQGVSPARMP